MSESLNEGLFDKRKINKRFKKYSKMMNDIISAYRNSPKGLDAKSLGRIGVYPFIEDQKAELKKSYTNAQETFSKVATPNSETTTPAAISTACALLYEFFNKYIDAKKLLNDMGLGSITSADRENKGIDAVRTMPKSAYQRMSKLMDAYNPSSPRNAALGMKQYKRLNDMYIDNVNKLNVLGNGYRDNFSKFTKKAITGNGASEIGEFTLAKLNDAIAAITMAWSKQIELLKADFPSMMSKILSSEEYQTLYSYLTNTVLAEIGKPVADYTANSTRNTDTAQAVHVGQEEPKDNDDIFTRLAASVEEPENAEHMDEGILFPGTIKKRGRKCVAKIKEMLTMFKEDEDGVSTKNVLKGILSGFNDEKKNVSIGIKPFVSHQVAVISDDYKKSKEQFEKAVNGNYTQESVNEEGLEVTDGNATTNAAVVAAGSAIIYQFLEKYTNAQKILSAAGVDIEKSRQMEVSSYENFSKMLGVYSPKALEGNSSSLPQFSKIRDSYNKMLDKFEKLLKGIINNFETSTKAKLTDGGKKMGEDDMNKLAELCTVLESSSEEKIGLFRQDFSSVVKEIVTSDSYQQYYNYIMDTILPEMSKGVKGNSSSAEITTAPDVLTVIDAEDNKENIGRFAYVFRQGVATESVSDTSTGETPDSSINELNIFGRNKDDKSNDKGADELPKTCVMSVDVAKGKPKLGDVYFVNDEPDAFMQSLETKLVDSGIVKEVKKGTKDLGDNIVKSLIGVLKNAFQKFKASGKPIPSHSSEEVAGLIEAKAKKDIERLTPVEGTDSSGNDQGEDNGNQNQTNQAAQPQATPNTNAEPAAGNATGNDTGSGDDKDVSASIKISYEIGKAISESGNEVELHRTIDAGRSRNEVYALSETLWGDGLVLNPIEKLNTDVKKMLESSKDYSDLAKYSKTNSNIRFNKLVANETYRVSMPRNRFAMLTNGNPLYECVALIEFDNSENRKVVSYKINEVSKITR